MYLFTIRWSYFVSLKHIRFPADPGQSLNMHGFELTHSSPHSKSAEHPRSMSATCSHSIWAGPVWNILHHRTYYSCTWRAHVPHAHVLVERFGIREQRVHVGDLGHIPRPEWSVRSREAINHCLPAEACVDSGFEIFFAFELWLKTAAWYDPGRVDKQRPFPCFWTDPSLTT